jgi:hypothetical protein
VLAGALCALAAPARAAITGVCPDGSMFIVQDRASVPCAEARQVEPERMPPLRPEYLPRPYGWQEHQRRQDPNNPYNLVDEVRRAAPAVEPDVPSPPRTRDAPSPRRDPQGSPDAAARPTAATLARAARPLEPAAALALNPDEVRDLFLIVELSQDRAPASFVEARADGSEALYVALAHSQSFELRYRQAGLAPPQQAGPVVLFSALAKHPSQFQANLFFTQDHLAFHPDHSDVAQFGVLEGALGEIGAEGVVLGYVVLPPPFDLARPIDLYWDDRRIETVLRP